MGGIEGSDICEARAAAGGARARLASSWHGGEVAEKRKEAVWLCPWSDVRFTGPHLFNRNVQYLEYLE